MRVCCIAVSPGLPLAVTSPMYDRIHVWDLKTGACKAIMEQPRGSVSALVMVGDASVILVGPHGIHPRLILWQLYV